MPRAGEALRSVPVHLTELESQRPPRAIAGMESYAAVEALVRRGGIPVGWVRLPLTNGGCPAETIAEALATLGTDPDATSEPLPSTGSLPSVTVALCTRDRPADLERCLESLARLEHPAHEVLVVDNAPASEATRLLVEEWGAGVRYVREPRPGLDWARNRAIGEATGDVVAFTDDDVVVDPCWVGAIASAFASDRSVAAVTGLVLPAELETEAQMLFERYRSFGRGFQRRRVAVPRDGAALADRYGLAGDYGTGANMAYRRELFEHIGRFDPALDVGTPARGGGDLEMFFRVLKEGHALVYEPRAIVRHRHRRTLAELRGQIRDHGIGFSAYIVRSGLAYPDERWAFARLACWWFAKVAFRAVYPKASPRRPLRALGLAELWGCITGLGRYPMARRSAERLAEESDLERAS